MFSEKGRELFPRDQVHAVVKINVIGAWDNHEFFRLRRGLVGADVDVKLEVSASIPPGVPEEIVRTVTENAKTLKFEQHGFEQS